MNIVKCNTCGGSFSAGEVFYSSLKNNNFLATTNSHGDVIMECCEACQIGLMEETILAEDIELAFPPPGAPR